MNGLAELTAKFLAVWPLLDERARRLMAASEAIALGYGGVSLVRRACGLSRPVIAKGVREIQAGAVLPAGRIRRAGAGRKPIAVSDPRLVDTLEALIADQTRGDPESPLRWTCKSTRTIARELARRRHPVSQPPDKQRDKGNQDRRWRAVPAGLRHDLPQRQETHEARVRDAREGDRLP